MNLNRSAQEFCSIHDDSCLILWDARTCSSPAMTARVPLIDHQLFASKSMAFSFVIMQIVCLLVCDLLTGSERIKIENLCA
ncbi:hypothetical protein HanOQP8_Chr01g0021661 [Helianthus annuus]|nr:hypothetical protein HanOQP8_Chr01g0021661 [Helianthus annuus]